MCTVGALRRGEPITSGAGYFRGGEMVDRWVCATPQYCKVRTTTTPVHLSVRAHASKHQGLGNELAMGDRGQQHGAAVKSCVPEREIAEDKVGESVCGRVGCVLVWVCGCVLCCNASGIAGMRDPFLGGPSLSLFSLTDRQSAQDT